MGKNGYGRVRMGPTGQDGSGRIRTGQDGPGKVRTGQDRTCQNRTGQDETRKVATDQDMTVRFFLICLNLCSLRSYAEILFLLFTNFLSLR